MKKWRILTAILLALVLTFSVACGGSTPAPAPAETPAPAAPAAPAPAAPAAPADDEEDEAEEDAVIEGDVAELTVVFGTDIGSLPREETLYIGGWQWGTVINGNPFSPSSNNFYVDQAVAAARNQVYEPLYMFNQLDGKLHPLVAGGNYSWNGDMTELTVPINRDAKWSDGSALTAHDVAATFDAHVSTASSMGAAYAGFIASVTATDDHTVVLAANPENHNPQKLLEYLPRVYVLQKAYIDGKFAQYGDDAEGFKNDTWFDAPYSGPYGPLFISSQKVICLRNDNYWGQASSMWGKLPVPKYLAHNVYASNDSSRAAFAAGQIDINQQYMTNVFDMWEKDGLPISTYLDDAPYYLPASMPSIWFNTRKSGLDQLAVREAIAYATDYEQIALSAMSGYSPSFEAEPRSIAAPLPGEKAMVDFNALSDLQWTGRDIARANKILDDAGIVDTNGDGNREYNGEELAFTLTCPMGWSDWEASLEIVAAAGAQIGINLTTNFVEAAVWTENNQTGNFDITMNTAAATSITAPWSRADSSLYVPDANAERVFWGWHRMQNAEINNLIAEAARETDPAKLKEYYTEISKFLLEQKPLVYLMYRPAHFQSQNETVWTGYPEEGDGTNVPPMILSGYGVGMLYNIRLR